jgi:hypothetical protein
MVGLQKALIGIESDLRELGYPWALVGGLAVSVRSEPRTTRDLDVAVAVDNDREAERLITSLRSRGYVIETLLEQEVTGRLATVRLLAPGEETGGVIVDLLFASSGAEPEIVASAERIEVLPGLVVPVATLGHLMALKVLAARTKDLADMEALLAEATTKDIDEARTLLRLITNRGCARNQDLLSAFAKLLSHH